MQTKTSSITTPLTADEMVVQVVATLAIENMFISNEIKNNLLAIANHRLTAQDVIKELDRKYA